MNKKIGKKTKNKTKVMIKFENRINKNILDRSHKKLLIIYRNRHIRYSPEGRPTMAKNTAFRIKKKNNKAGFKILYGEDAHVAKNKKKGN